MGLISKIKTACAIEKEARRNKIAQMLNKRYGTKLAPVRMYDKYPKIIRVITTRLCNMRCNQCPSVTVNDEKKYKQRFMDINLVKKIIDEVKDYPKLALSPFALEPLINPNTLDTIKYAVSKGVSLKGFFTNAQAMSEEKAKELLDAGLDNINFSIDAVDSEGYMLTRNSKRYDHVVNNVRNFLKIKEEGGYEVATSVSYVVSKETEAKVEKFRQLWEGKVDKVIFQDFDFQGGQQAGSFTQIKEKKKRLPCSYFWYRMNINIEGKIIFCADDWWETDLFGDVNKESITDIWTGEHYEKLRKIHINREFDKLKVCGECRDWHNPGKIF